MKDWLNDIDRIVTRHDVKDYSIYDVSIDIDHGWKHVRELDELEAVRYIRENLKELTTEDYHATMIGFEFIYKDGTNKFFEI